MSCFSPRMKCLEFLYFYLLDEHSFVVPSSTQRRTGSESSLPLSFPPSTTVTTPATSPLKASFGESITGSSDGGSLTLVGGGGDLLPAFSLSPKSRAAQSNVPTSPFEASLRASQRFRERLDNSTSLSSSGSSGSSFCNSNYFSRKTWQRIHAHLFDFRFDVSPERYIPPS
jgi:hypothetical protein